MDIKEFIAIELETLELKKAAFQEYQAEWERAMEKRGETDTRMYHSQWARLFKIWTANGEIDPRRWWVRG